jgi:hypothetical protein
MRIVLVLIAGLIISGSVLAQTNAPVAVPVQDQFKTFVDQCEKAKKCLGGDKNACSLLDSHKCVNYLEGVYVPMRMACNARKSNKDFPKAMAVKEAKTGEKIDVLIKHAKDTPADLVKHRGPVTVRALAKALPCEN